MKFGASILLACVSSLALAQDYPARPIRILVGAAAGGSLDASARIVGQKITEYTGQPVIVEARPGAGGTLANDRVAKSPSDGYTLLVMAGSGSIQSVVRTNLPYDLERDLAAVSLLTITPIALVVHPSVPVRSVKELLALARKHPGQVKYGTSGVGTTSHLAGEALNVLAGTKLAHVPYKGGAESVVAAASGQVEIALPGIASVPGLASVGKVVPIAVTTRDRVPLMPQLPTLHESGFRDFDFSSWAGMLAPSGVPKPIIARLNALVTKANSAPDLKENFDRQGMLVRATTPEEFADFIRKELALNRKLVKLAGITVE